MTFRIAILASGRGSNYRALQAAIDHGQLDAQIVGVFSDRATALVLQHAAQHGTPTWSARPRDYPDRLSFDIALLNAVAAVQPDLIVCAGYMRIIDGAALAPWIGRMINIHPSLLPKYTGLHTHRRAIEAGDAEHGASVHYVTAELDGGPVIAQARVAIEPDDDETRLAARVLQREHPLLCASVAALAKGDILLHKNTVFHHGTELNQPLRLNAQDQLEVGA